MAGCAGSVVNAVQAVLHALVAGAGGILAEVRTFDAAEGGAPVSVSIISVIAGLVAHNNAVPADLKADIARTVEGKADAAGGASDGVVCQVASSTFSH